MASSLDRELDYAGVDRKLNNLQLRIGCDLVCNKLRIRDVCSTSTQQDCLVEYPYGLTLGETYKVAMQAKFAERLQVAKQEGSSELTKSGSAMAEAVADPEPLPPFKPDWRFWSGITLAGLGLFLHRSR